MKKTFHSDVFKKAFQDVLVFEESELPAGGKKIAGKSPLVKVELEEDGNRNLTSAMMFFPFFHKDIESNRKITTQVFRFLDLCLPLAITPPDWMQSASRKLRSTDDNTYKTDHDGIRITLLQKKPEPVFVLAAVRLEHPAKEETSGGTEVKVEHSSSHVHHET